MSRHRKGGKTPESQVDAFMQGNTRLAVGKPGDTRGFDDDPPPVRAADIASIGDADSILGTIYGATT